MPRNPNSNKWSTRRKGLVSIHEGHLRVQKDTFQGKTKTFDAKTKSNEMQVFCILLYVIEEQESCILCFKTQNAGKQYHEKYFDKFTDEIDSEWNIVKQDQLIYKIIYVNKNEIKNTHNKYATKKWEKDPRMVIDDNHLIFKDYTTYITWLGLFRQMLSDNKRIGLSSPKPKPFNTKSPPTSPINIQNKSDINNSNNNNNIIKKKSINYAGIAVGIIIAIFGVIVYFVYNMHLEKQRKLEMEKQAKLQQIKDSLFNVENGNRMTTITYIAIGLVMVILIIIMFVVLNLIVFYYMLFIYIF